MHVVEVERFGGPEVLVWRERPDPVAGPGQVVVAVSVADVLFVETQVRSGWGRDFFTVEPPYVPGDAAGGEVISVGKGVDPSWLGRRVIARANELGAYAERVVAPLEALTPIPDGVGTREAVALVHDGPTALGVFGNAPVGPDTTVLIVAAAGGMGSLLVQLAHAAGARVIGTARGERKLETVRKLGADEAVDHGAADWPDRVRELTGGVGAEVVFDGAGGPLGGAAFAVTADGGHFSAHGAAAGDFAEIDEAEAARRGITVHGIQQVWFPPQEYGGWVERALGEAAAGRITPTIGAVLPLRRAAEAHAAVEARQVVGKALLEV
ncbi:zinc-binding dehydrogenase [Streptomyces calidiresistens]|uniref:Zinc-binding dehydrogenase n=1 Tax=Streptomyces calidiresistens TaxID=1485586 RepID=A0A7W3XV40_9ACTN|nr:zinc-binding dehydrogenase [Streptomyces calidiresistens]MBB0228337.1 zinc-binding dehydrogenase [Streptomyces calidiresistens]